MSHVCTPMEKNKREALVGQKNSLAQNSSFISEKLGLRPSCHAGHAADLIPDSKGWVTARTSSSSVGL